MNALFLLLTSVSAGDAVQVAPPAAGPIVSTPIPGGCGAGGGCGSTCDSCASDCCAKPSFCDRLKAKFHKSSPCCESTCAPTCAAPAPTCAAPAPACAPASCGCGSTCDTCCAEKKPSFFDRLKAKHKKSDCCPSTCDTCGAGYAGAVSGGCAGCAPAAGTIINAPAPGAPAGSPLPGKTIEPIKKMPKDDGKGASILPSIPVVPVTPAGARIETEVKNPF